MGERSMSHDIERVTLSCLLHGGWNHGGHVLRVEDFTDSQHRKVFQTIKRLAESGQTVDMFTVADQGIEVEELVKVFGSAKSIGGYVEILQDRTLAREVKKAANTILSSQGSGRERLLAAQSLLASLEGRLGGEAVALKDCLGPWLEEVSQRSEPGHALSTGFPSIDKRLGGLRGGDLFILAGRPSMGKTALALNIAEQCGEPTAVFSLEMTTETLMDRLICTLSGIPLNLIRSPNEMDDRHWPLLTSATKRASELPIYVDDTSALTIEDIHARARAVKTRHGLSLVIIDYLGQVFADRRMSTIDRVSHVSRMSKRMAKDLGVPVILLCQLSRKCEERGKEKRPIMSDLRDSGEIEQDADVIGFIYRDVVYNPDTPYPEKAELIFRKVRQGEQGTDWLAFNGATQKFTPTTAPPETAVTKFRNPYRKSGT